MTLNWNKFEVLLGAATGGAALENLEQNNTMDVHLQKVVHKRQMLEEQQNQFSQATEETILQEYKRLRKAHRDFMRSFNEAHHAYWKDSNQD